MAVEVDAISTFIFDVNVLFFSAAEPLHHLQNVKDGSSGSGRIPNKRTLTQQHDAEDKRANGTVGDTRDTTM